MLRCVLILFFNLILCTVVGMERIIIKISNRLESNTFFVSLIL